LEVVAVSLYAGFTIPKGWRIYVYTREINYDPHLYEEPLAFNPWRWMVRVDRIRTPGSTSLAFIRMKIVDPDIFNSLLRTEAWNLKTTSYYLAEAQGTVLERNLGLPRFLHFFTTL